AGAVLDRAGLDPVRPWRRRAFHEERISGGAVRITPHDHGAVVKMRQEHRGDGDVVLQQIALREPQLRPKRLAPLGEADGPASSAHLDGVDSRWDDTAGAAWRSCLRAA